MSRSLWMQPIVVCLHCSTDPDKMLFCCQQLDICRWASIPENVLFSRYYAELSRRHLMLLIQHNSTTASPIPSAPQIQLWCWHCAPYKCSYYYYYYYYCLRCCVYILGISDRLASEEVILELVKKTNVYHVCCMDWNVMPCQRVPWDR